MERSKVKLQTFLFGLFVFLSFHLNSQVNILSYEDYISQVKKYHPIVKQSGLVIKDAGFKKLQAKAQFDPSISSSLDRKTLDGKNYYNYQSYGADWNTNSPISLNLGHDRSNGDFINPELTNGGLSYLGIKLPLASGLMIDERRAALQSAKVLIDQSEWQQKAMVNDLLLDASNAYWYWLVNYAKVKQLDSFQLNAQQRLDLLKLSFVNGDRAAMDTVEASIQLQFFKLQLSEARLEYANAQLKLSMYLWNESDMAILLDESYIPESVIIQQFERVLNTVENSIVNNPDLKLYDYKIQLLNIENKLKRQYLLPKLDFKSSLLSLDNQLSNVSNVASFDNYKLGFSFLYPLGTRSAKAQIEQNKIKIDLTKIDQNFKQRDLIIKQNVVNNEIEFLRSQISITDQMIANTSRLRDFEILKFQNGESSLFLINSREQKVLESNLKKFDQIKKLLEAKTRNLWIAGKL